MWLNTNETWMNINDNDVDDLPGFAKKLEEHEVQSCCQLIAIEFSCLLSRTHTPCICILVKRNTP